jgi:tRNA 2-selenouridine synthase
LAAPPLTKIAALDAAAKLDTFGSIVDARSPAEYAEDHLPGAVNWPVLDDDERKVVGTEYKQISAFDARKRGAAMVARRIAEHLEAHVMDKPREWQPLVYCWRGGQRSGALAWYLAQVGFRTHVLDGGYKAFRALVREQLDAWPADMRFVVVAGRTGSGKTRLLQALAAQGAQVLDLEGLARHRGSILGGLPGEPQPAQRAFETAVWSALRGFDRTRTVFVESESRKIGARQVPDVLLLTMRAKGRCVVVEMPDDARVALLLEDYAFFTRDAEAFSRLLDALVDLQGRDVVRRWQAMARAGLWGEVYREMMLRHYDPLYSRSIRRNFDLAHALHLPIADGREAAMADAARSLIAQACDG